MCDLETNRLEEEQAGWPGINPRRMHSSFFADAGEIHDQLGDRHEAVVPSDGQPAEVPSPEVGSVCRVAFHSHRKTSERAEFWSKRALTASGGVGLSGHGKQGEKTPAYKLAGFLSASDSDTLHASGRSDATRSLEDCLLRSLLGLLSRLPSDRIPKPVTPLRQALDDLKPALVILKGTPQGVDGDLDSFFRVG